MKVNIKYLPKKLSRKDKKKQSKMLIKSRKLYKKGIYYNRKPVKSFKSTKSPHVIKAMKIYKVDKIQPDSNLAGINEIIAIDKLVKKKGLKLILHNWTNDINNSANIHLAAALESCSMLEANLTYNPLRNNLVKDPMTLSKGEFILSDKAGLGIELNQSIIDEYSFEV